MLGRERGRNFINLKTPTPHNQPTERRKRENADRNKEHIVSQQENIGSVMVGGCWSKLVNVLSAVPQGNVLGPLLFLLYTLELFPILENQLVGYADDSTLIAVVTSPDVRVSVASCAVTS